MSSLRKRPLYSQVGAETESLMGGPSGKYRPFYGMNIWCQVLIVIAALIAVAALIVAAVGFIRPAKTMDLMNRIQELEEILEELPMYPVKKRDENGDLIETRDIESVCPTNSQGVHGKVCQNMDDLMALDDLVETRCVEAEKVTVSGTLDLTGAEIRGDGIYKFNVAGCPPLNSGCNSGVKEGDILRILPDPNNPDDNRAVVRRAQGAYTFVNDGPGLSVGFSFYLSGGVETLDITYGDHKDGLYNTFCGHYKSRGPDLPIFGIDSIFNFRQTLPPTPAVGQGDVNMFVFIQNHRAYASGMHAIAIDMSTDDYPQTNERCVYAKYDEWTNTLRYVVNYQSTVTGRKNAAYVMHNLTSGTDIWRHDFARFSDINDVVVTSARTDRLGGSTATEDKGKLLGDNIMHFTGFFTRSVSFMAASFSAPTVDTVGVSGFYFRYIIPPPHQQVPSAGCPTCTGGSIGDYGYNSILGGTGSGQFTDRWWNDVNNGSYIQHCAWSENYSGDEDCIGYSSGDAVITGLGFKLTRYRYDTTLDATAGNIFVYGVSDEGPIRYFTKGDPADISRSKIIPGSFRNGEGMFPVVIPGGDDELYDYTDDTPSITSPVDYTFGGVTRTIPRPGAVVQLYYHRLTGTATKIGGPNEGWRKVYDIDASTRYWAMSFDEFQPPRIYVSTGEWPGIDPETTTGGALYPEGGVNGWAPYGNKLYQALGPGTRTFDAVWNNGGFVGASPHPVSFQDFHDMSVFRGGNKKFAVFCNCVEWCGACAWSCENFGEALRTGNYPSIVGMCSLSENNEGKIYTNIADRKSMVLDYVQRVKWDVDPPANGYVGTDMVPQIMKDYNTAGSFPHCVFVNLNTMQIVFRTGGNSLDSWNTFLTSLQNDQEIIFTGDDPSSYTIPVVSHYQGLGINSGPPRRGRGGFDSGGTPGAISVNDQGGLAIYTARPFGDDIVVSSIYAPNESNLPYALVALHDANPGQEVMARFLSATKMVEHSERLFGTFTISDLGYYARYRRPGMLFFGDSVSGLELGPENSGGDTRVYSRHISQVRGIGYNVTHYIALTDDIGVEV